MFSDLHVNVNEEDTTVLLLEPTRVSSFHSERNLSTRSQRHAGAAHQFDYRKRVETFEDKVDIRSSQITLSNRERRLESPFRLANPCCSQIRLWPCIHTVERVHIEPPTHSARETGPVCV